MTLTARLGDGFLVVPHVIQCSSQRSTTTSLDSSALHLALRIVSMSSQKLDYKLPPPTRMCGIAAEGAVVVL
jgi:hypothetical protein